MSNVNARFRQRIGLEENVAITFDTLNTVLEKTARALAFENLPIIAKETTRLTKENLINKIINKQGGGLCYDLNSILYLFLKENGFTCSLIRGITFNHEKQAWNTIGRTHVAILLTHHRQPYIVDTGFGGNLPLAPVPLNGEVVTSDNGEFRIEKVENELGDYIFHMKLKHKDRDWKIGYVFDSTVKYENIEDLNEVQTIIVEHQNSPFNKRPLVTRLTDNGSVTLTDTSLTEWVNGKESKREISAEDFEKIVNDRFGIKYHH